MQTDQTQSSSSTPSEEHPDAGTSSGDAGPPPIDERGGCRRFFGKAFRLVAMIFAVIVLALIGFGLGWGSFQGIETMRQFERIPEIPNSAVITGEVNLTGTVFADRPLLRSPKTNTETVHYRYIVEERKRDSDGDYYWDTVHTARDRIDFVLQDSTGNILISATDAGVELDASRKFRDRQGSMRYTEYRIDPGDEVFIFGYAQETSQGYQVGFREDGNYHPIISAGTEHEQRHSRAISSGLLIVLGVGAHLFAVFFLLRLFRVHHSAFYLSTATLVVVTVLCVQSFSMIVSDLHSANETATNTLEEGERVISEILRDSGIDAPDDFAELGSFEDAEYSGLSEEQRQRASGIRVMMAQSVQRTNNNLSRFPEMLVGPMIGVHRLEPIEVPADEQETFDALESEHQPVRLGILYGFGAIFVGVLGLLFGTKLGLRKIILKRTIENVPTSPTTGAVYGLTELKGSAEFAGTSNRLRGPLTSTMCVYFRYLVEREEGSGKDSKWVTVTDRSEQTPFFCRDQEGRMLIDPSGAEFFSARKVHNQKGRYRYTEWSIAGGDEIYALGSATINLENHEELILTDEDEDTPFIVSGLSEDELMQHKATVGFILLNLGIVATMMAGMGIAGMVVTFGPLLYVTTAAISCSYLFVVLVFLYYNDLVFLRERVQRNWSNIDVALKKRFDLITNLAEVVQEFMGHERRLQEEVTQARTARHTAVHNRPDNAEVAAEERARNQIIATVEDHPQLKSHAMVAKLMKALAAVENDIALMRQGYNDSVERYNTRIAHFPEVFVAFAVAFREASFLQTTRSEAERRPVPVESLGSDSSDSTAAATESPGEDAPPIAGD